MGKVSLFLIVIGLVFLVPAFVLTILAVFEKFIQNQPYWLSIVIVFIIGFLYIVAFAFLILGLIIAKRDKE